MKEAPQVVIWGTGTPRREFLYVDDMAAASVFVMQLDRLAYDSQTEPMQSHLNVGFGSYITIAELATAIAKVIGYHGKISFDPSKPDGAPKKLMDSSKINRIGWKPKMDLEKGLVIAYQEFLQENERV